jgi:site-specific DNA recombinase
VPAPEIEKLVLDGVRQHLAAGQMDAHPPALDDRGLVDRHVKCIVIKPAAIEVRLLGCNDESAATDEADQSRAGASPALRLPWAAPNFVAVKGVVHAPAAASALKSETRDAILGAIAKARTWIDDLVEHRVASFEEIAARENKAERHIRLLAPLAFVSPRIIAALIDGTAPADLTVTRLAKVLPYSWAEQERQVPGQSVNHVRHAGPAARKI